MADLAQYRLTERRIEQWTVVIGVAESAAAWIWVSWASGVGVLAGALLAWLNFRWLEGALDALMRVSTASAASSQKVGVPWGGIARLAGRYILIVGAVCVIFFGFRVPVLSMLVGLCALGAATMCASVYEIFYPVN
jgi:hypothetical protein